MLRLKDVLMMMILFHIWPEQTYRFSTRKSLPSKKSRVFKNLRKTVPYDLINHDKNYLQKIKEVNIVGRGSSFNFNNLKKIDDPVFLVSFWNSLKEDSGGSVFYQHYLSYETGKFMNDKNTMTAEDLDNYLSAKTKDKEFNKSNITYICNRKKVKDLLKKNGQNVQSIKIFRKDENGKRLNLSPEVENNSNNDNYNIEIEEKVYSPAAFVVDYPLNLTSSSFHPLTSAPAGSFLPVISAFSHIAEKTNVYGWDFYLDKSPENMNYWQLFFSMYKYKLDIYRSKNHFESAMLNYYYGYHFSKLSNVKIFGYLGKLHKHKKLIDRIERVLFQ